MENYRYIGNLWLALKISLSCLIEKQRHKWDRTHLNDLIDIYYRNALSNQANEGMLYKTFAE